MRVKILTMLQEHQTILSSPKETSFDTEEELEKRSKKRLCNLRGFLAEKDEATYLGVCEEVVGWFLTEQLHRGKVTGGGVSRQLLQQRPAAAAAAGLAASRCCCRIDSRPFPVRPKSSPSALICPPVPSDTRAHDQFLYQCLYMIALVDE